MSQNPTQSDPDEPAEALLRSHLSAELDSHVGRARAAFDEAIVHERARRAFWRRGLYAVGSLAAAAAVAAGIWIAWPSQSPSSPMHLANGQATSQPNPHDGLMSVNWSPTDVTRQQAWRTQEAGTVLIAGRPARAIVREAWQTTRFRDPEGFDVQIDVPKRDVVFINLPTQ